MKRKLTKAFSQKKSKNIPLSSVRQQVSGKTYIVYDVRSISDQNLEVLLHLANVLFQSNITHKIVVIGNINLDVIHLLKLEFLDRLVFIGNFNINAMEVFLPNTFLILNLSQERILDPLYMLGNALQAVILGQHYMLLNYDDDMKIKYLPANFETQSIKNKLHIMLKEIESIDRSSIVNDYSSGMKSKMGKKGNIKTLNKFLISIFDESPPG